MRKPLTKNRTLHTKSNQPDEKKRRIAITTHWHTYDLNRKKNTTNNQIKKIINDCKGTHKTIFDGTIKRKEKKIEMKNSEISYML